MLELKLNTRLSYEELNKLSASLTEMLVSVTISAIKKRKKSFDEDSFASVEKQNEWLSQAMTRQLHNEPLYIYINFDDKILVQEVLKSLCQVREHIRIESAQVSDKVKIAKYRIDFEDYINEDSDEIFVKYISEYLK